MNTKKNFLVLMVFLLAMHKGFAQDSLALDHVYSLKECVDIALKNNADVNKTELLMENSKVSSTLAKANMYPFLSGQINHGLSTGRSIDPFTNTYINQNLSTANFNVDASLALWNAGAIKNNIKANNLGYEASRMDLQQQKDNTTISVILAYLQVLNNQEQLNAAIQQADVTRKQVERLEVLNKDGAVAPGTYYDTKGQLANDEMNVIALKNALETSRLTLTQLMNVLYAPDLKVEKINIGNNLALYDGSSRQIYNEALQNLALVKAVDLRKESADKTVKSARGQMFPTLSLNGGVGTNYSSAATTANLLSTSDVRTDDYVLGDAGKLYVYTPQSQYSYPKISYCSHRTYNFNTYVNIGLRIPILNGLQSKSRLNNARIDVKRTELEAKTTKTLLQQAVEQAYLNMNTAYERYEKLQTQVQDFAESFRGAEVKFNEGAITSVDYLIIKNSFDRSNINLIAAKYDYILRTKILDFYQGRLQL